MPEDIFPEIPSYKLYTDESIRVATFLGGPLIAGYLIAENYKRLGESAKAGRTWVCAIAATVLIFTIAFYLPPSTPTMILPFAYSLGTFYLVKNLQGEKIKAHTTAGGKTWRVWRAIGISLIGLVITVIIVFGGFYLMDEYGISN